MRVNIGDVIAVRRFYWEGDAERQVVVSMGRPQQASAEGEFYCPFQITGIDDDERVEAIFGVDAFQAIELALRFIGSKLTFLNSQSASRLRWEFGEKGDLGFPSGWTKQ